MSEIKTKPTSDDVLQFIESVPDAQKRDDCLQLLNIFHRITGEEPVMWGSSIIGFGKYHYASQRSRQEGDWMMTGFSPRKANLTLYIMPGFDGLHDQLQRLGAHKTSVGCLYIKKLADVDLTVLEEIIQTAYLQMKQQYS